MTALLQGVPTAIVALIAAWIGYQQFRTARHQLLLNLYEKRYKVYSGLKSFLLRIVTKAKPELGDFIDVNVETAEADFLFGPEISKFISQVKAKASELAALRDSLSQEDLPVGAERTVAARKSHEILEWVDKQIQESAKVFAPYLNFRKIQA